MGVGVQISEAGLRELEKAVREKLQALAELVVSEAKIRCPVDTGNLRNSITWGEVENGYIVGSHVEYAPYQELGFHHYRSGRFIQNPYLLPGLRAALERVRNILS